MDTHRVVPMRLFATWEVDRTSPNCVPRICTMTLTRLTVLKPLESDLNCLVIAVKLQGYKRTLRSNDLTVSAVNGIIDIDLDISFTLQYPHFVKRKNNSLQLLLQRRKKYKNRPLPGGFKTLAVGSVNLTEVLQSSIDRELALYQPEDGKDEMGLAVNYNQQPAARVYFLACNSQPIEHDDTQVEGRKQKEIEVACDLSDEDADDDSTQEELGGSDSEPMADEAAGFSSAAVLRRMKGGFKMMSMPPNRLTAAAKHKNLKQKFVALLKKFKISEEALSVSESGTGRQSATSKELEALFEELENLSDSGPELDIDTLSIDSAPKPALRPYFNSTTSSKEALPLMDDVFLPQRLHSVEAAGGSEESRESDGDVPETDVVAPSPVRPKSQANVVERYMLGDKSRRYLPPKHASSDVTSERASAAMFQQSVVQTQSSSPLSGATVTKHKVNARAELPPLKHALVNEQLGSLMAQETNLGLPEAVWLISATDLHCQALLDYWRSLHTRFIIVTSASDVRAVLNAVVNRIQKFCNTNAAAPKATSVCLIGADRFLSFCLKAYTELFAHKTNEWQQYVRFSIVTPVNSVVSRCLASLDASFSSNNFCDTLWREFWDRIDIPHHEVIEITGRIQKYLLSAKSVVPIPIAEAMLQLRDKGVSDENSQVFVPFMVEVRVGGDDGDQSSPANQSPSATCSAATMTMSPTASPREAETNPNTSGYSPPASPHIHSHANTNANTSNEAQDLQIEYWSTGQGAPSIPTGSARSTGQTEGSTVGSASTPSGSVASSSGSANKKDGASKASLKTAFRSLVVSKLPLTPSQACFTDGPPSLSLHFVREKKKDKMLTKLGMKKTEKHESEQRTQVVESISRLICSSKHSTTKVCIDGVEWTCVKFFQVSAQWQTHVKQFPLSLVHNDFS